MKGRIQRMLDRILFAAFVPSCCVGLVDQFKNLSQKEIIYIDKATNGLQAIILYYWSIIQVGMISEMESSENIETNHHLCQQQ